MALTSAALLPLINERRQSDTNADAELTAYRAGSTNGTDISGFALDQQWRQPDTNADAELTAYRAGSTNGTHISGFASLDQRMAAT